MADLKCVYKAATLNAAESALDELENKWGEKYPMVNKSWRSKWPTLSAYFKYPDYVRKAIYTTYAVEAVHRQFRKLTKTKGGFANENSLLKLLYAGILKASERWKHPVQNWNLTLSQLAIHFPDRLDDHISLWADVADTELWTPSVTRPSIFIEHVIVSDDRPIGIMTV